MREIASCAIALIGRTLASALVVRRAIVEHTTVPPGNDDYLTAADRIEDARDEIGHPCVRERWHRRPPDRGSDTSNACRPIDDLEFGVRSVASYHLWVRPVPVTPVGSNDPLCIFTSDR